MRLGVISDLHWTEADGAAAHWHADYDFAGLTARCAAAVEDLVARGCDLLVVAGDLTHDGDEPSCDAALARVLSLSPIPVAVVEGNHDMLLDPDLVLRREDVRADWRAATALAADHGIALGAVRLGRPADRALERASLPVVGAPDCTLVVSHYPLLPHTRRLAAAGLPCPGELDDRSAVLADLRAGDGPVVVVSGHVHVRDASSDGDVLQLCVPALVEPPHEAAVIDVDPVAGTVRCERILGAGARTDARPAPWLLAPGAERWHLVDGAWRATQTDDDNYALREAS